MFQPLVEQAAGGVKIVNQKGFKKGKKIIKKRFNYIIIKYEIIM